MKQRYKFFLIFFNFFNCKIDKSNSNTSEIPNLIQVNKTIYSLKNKDKLLEYNNLVSLPIETVKFSKEEYINFLNIKNSEIKKIDFDVEAIKKELNFLNFTNKEISFLDFLEKYLPQAIDRVLNGSQKSKISKKEYYKIFKDYYKTKVLERYKNKLDHKYEQRKSFNYPNFWKLFDSIPNAVKLEDRVRNLIKSFSITELKEGPLYILGTTFSSINQINLKVLPNLPIMVNCYIHELMHLITFRKATDFVWKERTKFIKFSSCKTWNIKEIHSMENDLNILTKKLSELMKGFHMDIQELKKILKKNIIEQFQDSFIQKVLNYPPSFNRLILLEKLLSTGSELEAYFYQYFSLNWKKIDGAKYIDNKTIFSFFDQINHFIKQDYTIIDFIKKVDLLLKNKKGDLLYEPIYKQDTKNYLPDYIEILNFKHKSGRIYNRKDIITPKLITESFTKYIKFYMYLPSYLVDNIKNIFSKKRFMIEFFRACCFEIIDKKIIQKLEKNAKIISIKHLTSKSTKKVMFNKNSKSIILNFNFKGKTDEEYLKFYSDMAKEYIDLLKSLNR